jgi:hypothetical protein
MDSYPGHSREWINFSGNKLCTVRINAPKVHNCPGRFLLASVRPDLPPKALLGPDADLFEFGVEAARDKVVVAQAKGTLVPGEGDVGSETTYK